MTDTTDLCQICLTDKFKYTCPKCNIFYCSVKCYKAEIHRKCSEKFYKSCIEEFVQSVPQTKENITKMQDALLRNKAAYDENNELLDSDDDEEELDLVERIKDVDLNNDSAVWASLTATERNEFLEKLESGEILRMIPKYYGWWEIPKSSTSKSSTTKSNSKYFRIDSYITSSIPEIEKNISEVECKGKKKKSVNNSLLNIMTAYAYIVRMFLGDFSTNYFEAATHLINLSSALKYDTVFDDEILAVTSVYTEFSTAEYNNLTALVISKSDGLTLDAYTIMHHGRYKLAALSDIYRLLQKAKNEVENATNKEADEQKLLALKLKCGIISADVLKKLIVKIAYFLGFVNQSEKK